MRYAVGKRNHFFENYWNGPTLLIKWKKLETNKIPFKMIKILLFGKIRWSKFSSLKLQFYINFFSGFYFFTPSIFSFFKNLIFSKFMFSKVLSKLIFFSSSKWFFSEFYFFKIQTFWNSIFWSFIFFAFYFLKLQFFQNAVF